MRWHGDYRRDFLYFAFFRLGLDGSSISRWFRLIGVFHAPASPACVGLAFSGMLGPSHLCGPKQLFRLNFLLPTLLDPCPPLLCVWWSETHRLAPTFLTVVLVNSQLPEAHPLRFSPSEPLRWWRLLRLFSELPRHRSASAFPSHVMVFTWVMGVGQFRVRRDLSPHAPPCSST